ncbi:sensor histidine kinase [Streptomyces sp. 6N223]|uniref:sensor histidine kinase n=1 Tax=Streptomyces sp. 6N223 TaxID=3457412 RepID=UPI003FD4145E
MLSVTESQSPPDPSLRSELRIVSGVARALRADLFSGVLKPRPLPPLSETLPPLKALPEAARAYARWLPHAVVLAVAVALAVLTLDGWGVDIDIDFNDSAKLLGAVVVFVPPLVALIWPVAAFWLSFAGNWMLAFGGLPEEMPWSTGGFVEHIVVMMVVAANARPRVAAEIWLMTVLLSVGYEITNDSWYSSNTVAMAVASFAALLAVVLTRDWSETRRAVDVQAAVTARERSKRTLLEERTTIARELHDVVAHHMSVVAIQAEAAPYRVENPPPELEKAFATIRENALIALSELRRVLGVVRAADYEAPDAPQPTLAELDGLLDNVREAGLEVEKAVTGAVRELPQGIELSAYRIIQEALSNAMRHAPGAAARVEISYVLGGVGLRIVNGPPTEQVPPSPGAGHGITGMRERVAMLGGAMTAEPTGDGGYETAVFIPVPVGGGPEGDGGSKGGTGGEGEAT